MSGRLIISNQAPEATPTYADPARLTRQNAIAHRVYAHLAPMRNRAPAAQIAPDTLAISEESALGTIAFQTPSYYGSEFFSASTSSSTQEVAERHLNNR